MSKDIRRTVGVSLFIHDQAPTIDIINYWAKQLDAPPHATVHVDDTDYLEFSWVT